MRLTSRSCSSLGSISPLTHFSESLARVSEWYFDLSIAPRFVSDVNPPSVTTAMSLSVSTLSCSTAFSIERESGTLPGRFAYASGLRFFMEYMARCFMAGTPCLSLFSPTLASGFLVSEVCVVES